MEQRNLLLVVASLLLLLVSLSSSSCFQSSSVDEPKTPSTESSSSEEEDSSSRRQIDVALDMFHKFYNKENHTNLFFSPHSIHQALMMTYFGSGGETKRQLQEALHLMKGDRIEQLIKAFKMENFYQETRSRNTTKYDLTVANKIYFDLDEPIRDCVKQVFSQEVELVNIKNETEKAREQINKWIEGETRGNIKDLVTADNMDGETRIAVLNAAYFKGNWEQQFKKSSTKLGLFYVSQKEVTPVMMMYQKGSFRHGVSEELKAYIIELPYEGGDISMYILLPPFEPNALAETVSRLNATTLGNAMDGMYPDSIEIMLPRFKIKQNLDLSQALQAVGVTDLFDQVSANLTAFSSRPGLAIGSALHTSYLEVNEEGATAAAVTALIGTRSGRPLDQTRFVCNHPFLFLIYDNQGRNVLFMGAFRNPKLASNKS